MIYLFLLCSLPSVGQTCSSLSTPRDKDIEVPVDTPVRWRAVPNIIGYVVSLGTTPGGGEIINRRSSGQDNFYIPEVGLPADTQIYVTIGYFSVGRPFTTCEIETFRTVAVTTAPNCTALESPSNGSSNISADAKLEWAYAATATGYLLSLGITPGGNEVLDNLNVGNVLSYELQDGLPADREVYITIVPYNDIGEAKSCIEERFETTSVVIDCGPFFDYISGQTISLGPTVDFPDSIGFCDLKSAITVESIDEADGYRWYFVNQDGSEILLSTEVSAELSEVGNYRLEAYNTVTRSVSSVECSNSKTFTVVPSERAFINSIDDERTSHGRRVTVNFEGTGNYEFAMDHRDGPYQDDPVFSNVSDDYHQIYVRDKFGCGISESSIQRNLSIDDFPKFFTPNGDNVNDFWQFIPPRIEEEIILTAIHIFDRYGSLLAVIDPQSQGWDGNLRGRPLPSSDYWFRAFSLNKQEVKGHFSLKR